jgi:hypothetical protein
MRAMPKAYDTWKVLPHRPLEKLAASVWRVEGDLEGMPLKRVMTIARRADGAVVVHNAIALEEDAMKEIEAWGAPAYLLVPNGYHRLDARVFKDRYPAMKVYCPRGARAKVEQVVKVDGAYEDFPADDRVTLCTLDGTAAAEGAMLVRDGDETTLVVNDAVFNMPHVPGFYGFVLKNLTQSTGGPRISRVARWFIVKDSRAFAAHLERLADTKGLSRVIVSHHETIATDAAGALRQVAGSLR